MEFQSNPKQQECIRNQKENEVFGIMFSNESIYCSECNTKTPTINFEIIHKQITKINRNESLEQDIKILVKK